MVDYLSSRNGNLDLIECENCGLKNRPRDNCIKCGHPLNKKNYENTPISNHESSPEPDRTEEKPKPKKTSAKNGFKRNSNNSNHKDKKDDFPPDYICCATPIIIIVVIGIFVYSTFSQYAYNDECLSKINASVSEYNKTKSLNEKNDHIPIKGKVMITYVIDSYPGLHQWKGDSYQKKYGSISNLTENFNPNENITVFCKISTTEKSTASFSTSKNFGVSKGSATGYAVNTEIIVIYWPEMKIAGWNSIQGEGPKVGDLATYGEAYGDDLTDEWIKSLPRA